MDVVCFFHPHVVIGKLAHYLCQVIAECIKDVYTQAEVGSIKEGLPLVFTSRFYFVQVFQPPGGSGYHWNVCCKSPAVILQSTFGRGELNGGLGASELGRIKFTGFVEVDGANDFVPALQGDFFNFVPHLAVTD
ncbi:hypothetical protein SDC9_101803 [bioreactor metagenome]|uniref:Uncharacterized protein n=1 Tax=bioreactor metagenome TaxID=1076179 RepID=A0A645AQH4_9ZZZZ